MASIGKLAEIIGKGAGKAKATTSKLASSASSKVSGAKSKGKAAIADAVRGATSSVKKPASFEGMGGKSIPTGAKVAGGAAGVAGGYAAIKGATSGSSDKKTMSEPKSSSSSSSASKNVTKAPKAPASKPASKSGGSGVNTTSAAGIKSASKYSVYRAKKGDGLWQVAEKTVPKGQSVAAWWTQIKKLNSTNGKVNRTYQNTGVKLPQGAQPKDSGYEKPKAKSANPKAL